LRRELAASLAGAVWACAAALAATSAAATIKVVFIAVRI
jgi:hypothetical protein